MDIDRAKRLLNEIAEESCVLDVGGGASPFPRADYVIDALPISEQGQGSHDNAHKALGVRPRYSAQTWVQADLCGPARWPFPDKKFDFAVCSHVLEDVRDPIFVCSELIRVAKAGYVEVPSRIVEQSLGIEHPSYTGYYHHRWLISATETGLQFRHKPHSLHSRPDTIVARLKPGVRIRPSLTIVTLDWVDSFTFDEIFEFSEEQFHRELSEFAQSARHLTGLLEADPMPPVTRLKKQYFRWKQAHGLR